MADLTRSLKSASDWTENEFLAYDIKVVGEDVTTFLGNPISNLPVPLCNPRSIPSSSIVLTDPKDRYPNPPDSSSVT